MAGLYPDWASAAIERQASLMLKRNPDTRALVWIRGAHELDSRSREHGSQFAFSALLSKLKPMGRADLTPADGVPSGHVPATLPHGRTRQHARRMSHSGQRVQVVMISFGETIGAISS